VNDEQASQSQRGNFGRDGSAFREKFVLALPEHSVTGGAAYDALVAATAAAHSASLISCDRRAALVYESYGLRATFIA
jgi:predicted nucleic acid-binding protein